MSPEELAKLSQNPVGNLINVPFQNNTNFNDGPLGGHAEHPEHPACRRVYAERGRLDHGYRARAVMTAAIPPTVPAPPRMGFTSW